MEAEPGSPASPKKPLSIRTDRAFTRFRIAGWTVDPATNRVSRGEEETKLEPKVMGVLMHLCARPNEVVTREELEASVWKGSVVGYDTLTGAVQKLRRTFDDDPKEARFIETISKKGYRLVAPVLPLIEPDRVIRTRSDIALEPARFPRLRRGSIAALILSLAVTAALLAVHRWNVGEDTVARDTATHSIAVLPFENLGGDPEQEYFADGLTDDLITGLAKRPDLAVIARDSTFFYKDHSLDVPQVADKLNVRFVLDGSVRRRGEGLRINVQLIDAKTGAHLWAERYDGRMSNVFAFQDDITRKILLALALKVNAGEAKNLGTARTDNTEAYDSFLYGRQLFYRYANEAENRKARNYFQRAIDIDPKFAMAYAMLAWTHAFHAMNGWGDGREGSLRRAYALATQAIELQESIPLAYFVRGLVSRETGEYAKALAEAKRAIQYNPSYASAYVLRATIQHYQGSHRQGLESIEKAIALNPHHPYNYTLHLGQAYFILGRYTEAIEAFQRGIDSNPASARLHVWLAAAYAQAGKTDEARWEVDQIATLNP